METSDRFGKAKQVFQEQQKQKQEKEEEKTMVFESQLRKKKISPQLDQDWYLFKGKLFNPWRYEIYNKNKERVFSIRKKAFKLREDIRVYTDLELKNEVLKITTKEIIDLWSTYEIYDSSTSEIVGYLKCRGLFRGHWVILSADKIELARLKERTVFAVVGYFLGRWLPRQYDIKTNEGQKIGEVNQNFNPFIARYVLKVKRTDVIDSRLLIGVGILVMSITFSRKR